MTVWVLILQAVLAGSTTNIFVGTFDSQSSCTQFVRHELPKYKPYKLLCQASEVKTYP